MITLTVKIADSGTIIDGNGISGTGHMWLSLDSDGTGPLPAVSMGYGPDERDGAPLLQGRVYDNDDETYASTYYTGTICISDTQYDELISFRTNPSNYGFDANFYTAWNSCIDFAWKALEIIDLNPSGFQGLLWPTWNAGRIDSTLYTYLLNGLSGWHTDWSAQGSYDVIYGSKDNDELKAQAWTDAIYGGGGDDTIIGNNSTIYLEGNDGNDIYLLQSTGGIDTIIDHSGDNQLQIVGIDGTVTVVSGVFRPTFDGGQIYYSADKAYEWQMLLDGDWRVSARNPSTGEYKAVADIDHWQPGEFGITLGTAASVGRVILSDPNSPNYLNMDGAAATKAVQFQGGAKSDSFSGSNYSDLINTGDGLSNYVLANGGDDKVQGGDSKDFIRTGGNGSSTTVSDNDIAFGGKQSDVLLGGYGSDQLWGNADDADRLTFAADSSERGDWLSGENGNDSLYGSRSSDVVFGGEGEDLLSGGAGDDLLVGDAQYTPSSGAVGFLHV
jgi:Ca2+-binding RTX toxin-like protein